MSMFSPQDLRRSVAEHLDDVVPPPLDELAVRRRARQLRGRMVAAGLVVAASLLVAAALLAQAAVSSRTSGDFVAPPRIDEGQGLRAIADPGGLLSYAGQSVPTEDYGLLDTDAVATAWGIVLFDRGRPSLLGAGGEVQPLVDGDVVDDPAFHPTAKADAGEPWVTFAVLREDGAELVVRDLSTGESVATRLLGCREHCRDVVVEALDSGAVVVRTSTGVYLWRMHDDGWRRIAGPDTQVADVRSRVVLHTGPAPTLPGGWRAVRGQVDAQLTFDGAHVLWWSAVLQPTTPGGTPIRLDLPPRAAFFTLDTDGSVLAATSGRPTVLFDCTLPSGACERVARVAMTGGDPLFIGNDM